MINFELRNLPDLFFGRGAEKRCGELLKDMGAHRVLIHHSGEPFVLPLIQRIMGYLQEAGLWCTDLGGVQPNPRLSLIYEGIALCRKENIDAVLAVGGGSVGGLALRRGVRGRPAARQRVQRGGVLHLGDGRQGFGADERELFLHCKNSFSYWEVD